MTIWTTINNIYNQLFNIENLEGVFDYNSTTPLIFTQLYFWIFFAFILVIYSFIYKKNKLRNAFLFLVSIFFYYKTSGFFFSILLRSQYSEKKTFSFILNMPTFLQTHLTSSLVLNGTQ